MKNKIQLAVLIALSIAILIGIPKLSFSSNKHSKDDNPYLLTLEISEVVTKNGNIIFDDDGDYSDYVEIYNTGDSAIFLKGYGLSDEPSVPLKWTFPEIELAPHTYLIVFASGKNKNSENLHTNFKLNENGDRIAITDPNGNLIQALALYDTISNMSYCLTDVGTYAYYTTGTPGEKNEGIVIDDLKAYKKDYSIAFSQEPGFYTLPTDVTLTVPNPGVTIHYTLDGKDPSIDAPMYESPIHVESRDSDPLVYANISPTFGNSFQPSSSEVFKGTVIKAQAFLGDVPMGSIATNTYFITPLGNDRYTFPVISLTTDPYNFFDEENGIYVVGSKFKALAPSKPDGSTPANYNQRGKEWERPIHLEYFDQSGLFVFEQNLGTRTMGGWSRANPKKSLKLFARNSYQEDASTMDYPFFEDLEAVDGQPIDSFDRLMLRGGGNDWESALIRDPFMQGMVAGTLDTQASQPVILFINGEYWGIYCLNETLDEYYVQSHYGIAKEDVTIMTNNYTISSAEVYVGTDEDMTYYNKMIQFLEENDLSLQENYDYISTLIDLDNLIEYYVAEIYFCNTDWPANNMKFWRKRTTSYEPDAPYGQDGRYRYMLYDTDFGFALYEDMTNPQHRPMAFAAAENGPDFPNPEWSTLLFRSLLKNETFKQKFINVLADNLNTRFEPKTVFALINSYKDVYKPEMEEYTNRWQMWGMPDEKTWEDRTLLTMQDFALKRPKYVRADVKIYFKLDEIFDLTLTVNDAMSGSLFINDHINVLEDDTTLVFTGKYFSNIPVTLEAKPKEGYHFIGWEGSVISSEPILEVTLTSDLKITALFERN